MKSLTKKAILLASVVAAAGTFAVCAATVTVNEPTVDAKNVTVPFTADVADTDQITILAYYAPNGTEAPSVDNIVYIDQMAKSAATGNQITFSLRDGDADGKYKVLMGGTGVAVAGNSEFTVGGGTATGVKVSGTTLAITVGDPYVNEVTNNAATYDISLRKADDMSTVLYQMAVNEETGEYSIENVVAGDYIMVMSRPGFLTRYCNVTVEATDVTVAYKELVLGDLDDSHDVVSTADNDAIAGAVQNGDINVYEVAEAYPVQYDFDVDGNIGTADVDTQAAVIAAGDISAFDAYTDADDNSDYYYGG